jgi:hypothetical protein
VLRDGGDFIQWRLQHDVAAAKNLDTTCCNSVLCGAGMTRAVMKSARRSVLFVLSA